MRQHKRPIWLGAFLAVVVPAAAVPLLAFSQNWSGASFVDTLVGASILSFATAIYAAPALLLGIPFVLWLRSRGALTWFHVCLGAAIIGAVSLALISWAVQWGNPIPAPRQFLIGAVFGLLGGLGFCIGAGPNNSFKPNLLRSGNGVAE